MSARTLATAILSSALLFAQSDNIAGEYNGPQVVVLAVVLTGFPLFSHSTFLGYFCNKITENAVVLKKFPRKSHRTDNFTLSPVRRRCTQYDEYNGSIVRASYWKLEASVVSY